MGRGSSKVGGGGGGGSTAPTSGGGQLTNDQALTRQFLDGIANSQSDTQIALSSAMAGSRFSIMSDDGKKTEYQKISDSWDGGWNEFSYSPNGTLTSQMVVTPDKAALAAFNNRADIFSMNFKAPAPIPKSRVSVQTSDYARSHMGKSPSGRGTWAFDIGGNMVTFYGKYADARKAAVAQAASQGIHRIMTLG